MASRGAGLRRCSGRQGHTFTFSSSGRRGHTFTFNGSRGEVRRTLSPSATVASDRFRRGREPHFVMAGEATLLASQWPQNRRITIQASVIPWVALEQCAVVSFFQGRRYEYFDCGTVRPVLPTSSLPVGVGDLVDLLEWHSLNSPRDAAVLGQRGLHNPLRSRVVWSPMTVRRSRLVAGYAIAED